MAIADDELPGFFAALGDWAAATGVAVETVPYGPHADQVIELRRAVTHAGTAPRGVVLVLHGGFWRAAYDRSSTVALATALALEGWTTANAEYRRSGPGAWREVLDDVAAAAAATGADRAIGHSAGGHLALWLAAERSVARAVSLGGVCDLRRAAEMHLGRDAVQELLGGSPEAVPEAYAAADPAARLPLGVPHALVHGTLDEDVPVELARAYAAEARTAGDDCRLVELDGAGHFEPIDPRSAAFPAVHAALAGSAAAGPLQRD